MPKRLALVRPRIAARLVICRLIQVSRFFLFGFEVPAAIGLFIPGKWMTFANAMPFVLAVAVVAFVWSQRRPPVFLNQANPSTNQLSVLPFDPTARLVIVLMGGGFLLHWFATWEPKPKPIPEARIGWVRMPTEPSAIRKRCGAFPKRRHLESHCGRTPPLGCDPHLCGGCSHARTRMRAPRA